MKYLIVVFVVAFVVWLMLRGRGEAERKPRGRKPQIAPTEMVRCSHCGLHLPRSDAVQDSRGAFCTEAHRLAGPRD